jgi:glutathione S-transferase
MASTRGGFELDLATSIAATVLRGGFGLLARPAGRRPPLLFELYEFEGCPYCRLVREALTELDLDALVYPCPKGGRRYRDRVAALGGKTQFPYLVDPNTGRALYESADIIAYLFETYGPGELPLHWQWIGLQQVASGLASLPRSGAGRRAADRPERPAPAEPLELYSFESSPFARLVRERLCELELPYVLRSCGRANARDWVPPQLRDALGIEARPETLNRQALAARAGRISIPYLVDPNTGVEMAESRAILEYLDRTYG